MRAVLVLAILGCAAGCGEPLLPDGGGPGMDPGGSIFSPGGCQDNSCPTGEVCARIGGCTPLDEIRAIHIYWTVSGKPANATTCAPAPSLYLQVAPPDSFGIGWAPVPCSQGKFTVDKIPISFSEVDLSARYSQNPPQRGTIDAITGEVTIDLPF